MSNPALEPRLNQILTPLLSVIDSGGAARQLRAVATGYQVALVTDRAQTSEANVLEVIHDLLVSGADAISIGQITERFIERYGSSYERPITARWVGNLIRNRLHLTTYKSHGVYVIENSELPKLEVLWQRYGVAMEPASDPGEAELPGGHGDVGTSVWVAAPALQANVRRIPVHRLPGRGIQQRPQVRNTSSTPT